MTLAAVMSLDLLPIISFGQAPPTINVCDIAKQPEQFNGKTLTVRSRINFAFEEFELSAATCDGPKIEGIWLEYGRGPKRQPTIWCCGDMVPRDRLKLVQNDEFRKFRHYLTAHYSVTATITGRVDAVRPQPCPNGKGLCCDGGFGHLGFSCARLVIQSVSDVVAEQAPSPPVL